MTPNEILALFGVTMLLILVCMVTVIILSVAIKPFGEWGDKKLMQTKHVGGFSNPRG